MDILTIFLRPVHAGASHGSLSTFAEFNDQASQLLNFSTGRGVGEILRERKTVHFVLKI